MTDTLNIERPLLLWSPRDSAATNMSKFRNQVARKYPHVPMSNYADLHSWSVHPSTALDFWKELFEFEGLQPEGLVGRVLGDEGAFRAGNLPMYPPPAFFPDIRMNFTEHILAGKRGQDIALFACGEGGKNLRSVTWAELRKTVEDVADALVALGVGVGDRIAAIISNCTEAIIICLATLSIGAIWSTSSPDMGAEGIFDRLVQIGPKLVFFETSVLYNGKLRNLNTKNNELITTLRKVPEFQIGVMLERDSKLASNLASEKDVQTWSRFLLNGTGKKLQFSRNAFNHPGFIVYSSGTTGSPKCIVHSACGLLLQVKKDYMLHLDVRPGDTIYQYTTTGWIMWAMVLCGLSYGGRVLVYDGSPFIPEPTVTLRLASMLNVSLFGTSAKFLSDLKAMDIKPRELFEFPNLRTVSSTGSVLNSDVCTWFYEEAFPPTVHLASGSGGTDLACSLVGGDPTSPLFTGEIQGPALGMAVDVLNSSSEKPLSLQGTTEPGELVCRSPFPSQPVMFWGNGGMAKYKAAYFEKFGVNIWNQGDFVARSPLTGGFTMLGRSDGVLNPSGIRFGSAEIYNVTNTIGDFEDTLCVGQRRPSDTDETVILFVKMKTPKTALTPELVASTKAAIATRLSPRHVPKYIFEVPDIPYTTNGKKIELAVKQIVSGNKVTPSGAVANPETLEYFEQFQRLEQMVGSKL
ncbi:acetoacetate-CoA ligase [Pyrenochaeta sp. DS3sAY3a]|nr:acetoacetate-CoA ligase [Pyrenochaeta sp. DS3sAY3a]